MKTRSILLVAGIIVILFSCKRKDTSLCQDCQHGGYCVGDTCTCLSGYEGTKCETKASLKFLGDYSVLDSGNFSWTSSCIVDTNKYVTFAIHRTHMSTIYEGSKPGEILISNYFGDGTAITAEVKQKNLTIGQEIKISYPPPSKYITTLCFLNENYYPTGILADATLTISINGYCYKDLGSCGNEIKQTKCISVFSKITP